LLAMMLSRRTASVVALSILAIVAVVVVDTAHPSVHEDVQQQDVASKLMGIAQEFESPETDVGGFSSKMERDEEATANLGNLARSVLDDGSDEAPSEADKVYGKLATAIQQQQQRKQQGKENMHKALMGADDEEEEEEEEEDFVEEAPVASKHQVEAIAKTSSPAAEPNVALEGLDRGIKADDMDMLHPTAEHLAQEAHAKRVKVINAQLDAAAKSRTTRLKQAKATAQEAKSKFFAAQAKKAAAPKEDPSAMKAMLLNPTHYDFSNERKRKAAVVARKLAARKKVQQAKLAKVKMAEKVRQAELHQKDKQMVKDRASEKAAKQKLFKLSHSVDSLVAKEEAVSNMAETSQEVNVDQKSEVSDHEKTKEEVQSYAAIALKESQVRWVRRDLRRKVKDEKMKEKITQKYNKKFQKLSNKFAQQKNGLKASLDTTSKLAQKENHELNQVKTEVTQEAKHAGEIEDSEENKYASMKKKIRKKVNNLKTFIDPRDRVLDSQKHDDANFKKELLMENGAPQQVVHPMKKGDAADHGHAKFVQDVEKSRNIKMPWNKQTQRKASPADVEVQQGSTTGTRVVSRMQNTFQKLESAEEHEESSNDWQGKKYDSQVSQLKEKLSEAKDQEHDLLTDVENTQQRALNYKQTIDQKQQVAQKLHSTVAGLTNQLSKAKSDAKQLEAKQMDLKHKEQTMQQDLHHEDAKVQKHVQNENYQETQMATMAKQMSDLQAQLAKEKQDHVLDTKKDQSETEDLVNQKQEAMDHLKVQMRDQRDKQVRELMEQLRKEKQLHAMDLAKAQQKIKEEQRVSQMEVQRQHDLKEAADRHDMDLKHSVEKREHDMQAIETAHEREIRQADQERVVERKWEHKMEAKHEEEMEAAQNEKAMALKHEHDMEIKHQQEMVELKKERDLAAKHEKDMEAKHQLEMAAAKRERVLAAKHIRDMEAKHEKEMQEAKHALAKKAAQHQVLKVPEDEKLPAMTAVAAVASVKLSVADQKKLDNALHMKNAFEVALKRLQHSKDHKKIQNALKMKNAFTKAYDGLKKHLLAKAQEAHKELTPVEDLMEVSESVTTSMAEDEDMFDADSLMEEAGHM